MPISKKLNDAKLKSISKAKVPGKKYYDGQGLMIRILKSGAMNWQVKFRAGVESSHGLGSYPEVSLSKARQEAARFLMELRLSGVNPNVSRRITKKKSLADSQNSFETVARAWFLSTKSGLSESYSSKVIGRLKLHVFPQIGKLPIHEIERQEAFALLKRVQESGSIESAHRIAQTCSKVFQHAMLIGQATVNPFQDIGGALARPVVQHMPAITDPLQLAAFLRHVQHYSGRLPGVKAALQLLPMMLLRPGELRQGRWEEIDFEKEVWHIPSSRMKRTLVGKAKGEPHLVPLPKQAMSILRELKLATGGSALMFPGLRSHNRPISDNTLNAALRTMGYDTRKVVTAHGFRATVRTMAVEVLGQDVEVIEAQLAHSVRDSLGRSYNRTTFLPQRREVLQLWADFLDELREGRWSAPVRKAA